MIENVDQRSKDYSEIAKAYRPGHADYAYDAKYGIRDYRGGGRSSARETAARVAAGAVARLVIPRRHASAARWCRSAARDRSRANFDWDEIGHNPFFCPDADGRGSAGRSYLDGGAQGGLVARRGRSRSSPTGVPAGWGAPIYGKLDAELAARADERSTRSRASRSATASRAAGCSGEENADEMRPGNDGRPIFLSNHAGGIARRHLDRPAGRRARRVQADLLDPDAAPDRSTRDGDETEIVTKGRHDPCVGIRGAPVVEAMVACVLADAFLRHRGQVG